MSDISVACQDIAKLVGDNNTLGGMIIERFIEELDNGETPRMAAAIVKYSLINGTDLSIEDNDDEIS